jgi:hypothetical protein
MCQTLGTGHSSNCLINFHDHAKFLIRALARPCRGHIYSE